MRAGGNDMQEVQSGELRWPVAFQLYLATGNGSGGRTEAWTSTLETRCNVRGVKATEKVEGGRDATRNTVLIRIRYRPEDTPTVEHRAVINGITYEVTSIQDRTGKRRTLWIEAVSLPNE